MQQQQELSIAQIVEERDKHLWEFQVRQALLEQIQKNQKLEAKLAELEKEE